MTVRTGVVSSLAMVAMLTGCGDASSSLSESAKTQFLESFNKSCQSSAARSGAPADKIDGVCKCTGDAIVEKYSAAEIATMKPEEALPLLKECAAKAGLPV